MPVYTRMYQTEHHNPPTPLPPRQVTSQDSKHASHGAEGGRNFIHAARRRLPKAIVAKQESAIVQNQATCAGKRGGVCETRPPKDREEKKKKKRWEKNLQGAQKKGGRGNARKGLFHSTANLKKSAKPTESRRPPTALRRCRHILRSRGRRHHHVCIRPPRSRNQISDSRPDKRETIGAASAF